MMNDGAMVDLVLRNATLPDGSSGIDFAVDQGIIAARGSNLEYLSSQEIDLAGKLLIPGFVESHVHLDIALMNSWDKPGRQEPFRVMSDLNESLEKRRIAFNQEDIENRASMALKMASRHGVTAMRAQCHVDPVVGLRHLKALLNVKEKYQDLVTLQIVAFPQQGLLQHPGTFDLFREVFDLGADIMGCASNLDLSCSFQDHIDAAFELAMEMYVDLDIHADLSIPEHVELEELEIVYCANRALENGYQGRVTVGHACALDSALPEVAKKAIQLIAEAQINVVSQPDLYRLGREDTHHLRRGLTRVKELLDAGVNVTYASNNVRDALRPMGNFDLLEEGLILAYGAHMDTEEQLNTLLQMSTFNAAKALNLQNYGLEVGCIADLVVLNAPSPAAAIISQSEKKYVFKSGKQVATTQVVSDSYFEQNRLLN
jgi:cytosine deaminase